MRSCLILAACALGCNTSQPIDNVPYPTFQACWDETRTVETFSIQRSIEICCISHPIGDPPVNANLVCGDTAATCTTYVTANLAAADATADDIAAACSDYVAERSG